MARINKKIIEIFLLLLFLCFLIGMIIANVIYTIKLEEQLVERDNLIRELTFRSKLVEDYFNIEHDSITNKTSYILKEVHRHKPSVSSPREQNINTQINEVINDYNNLSVEVDSLIVYYNQLQEKYIKTKNEEITLRTAWNLVEGRYSLKYITKPTTDGAVIYLQNTEKIDSALILLPYYRQNITRPNDSIWVVSYTKDIIK